MVQKIKKAVFPDENKIFEWIKGFTKWPHRKTGTKEGRASAEYVKEQFLKTGLQDVKIEQADSVIMDMEKYELFVEGEKVEAFYANATNRGGKIGTFEVGSDNLYREVVYLGKGTKDDFEDKDVRGKLVLCDVTFYESHPTQLLDWNENALVIGSVEKIRKPLRKYDIFTPKDWPYNYYRAMDGGAAGFIGILHDFMDCHYYHEDYSDIERHEGSEYMSLPAMWVSREDGMRIVKRIKEQGHIKGLMRMKTTYRVGKANNVVGKLRGMSDEVIMIHSHHDAVCEGAVQDASGMSIVFALAEYFAQFEKKDLPKTLLFAATDSHYTDYEGHEDLLKRRRENGENIIADIVIEHIAKEVDLDNDMNMIETGEPETRMLYVSDRLELVDIVKKAFEKYDLDKTVMFPVGEFNGDGNYKNEDVCSDATLSWMYGIPVVSVLAAPMYLYHNTDTLDRVYRKDLRKIGIAFAEIISEIMDREVNSNVLAK